MTKDADDRANGGPNDEVAVYSYVLVISKYIPSLTVFLSMTSEK